MKLFYGKTIGFILLFLVINSLVNNIYANLLLSKVSPLFYVDANYRQNKENISVLVLGDSHPMVSVDPEKIGERVFNYSSSGESYTQTYYKAYKILNDNHSNIDVVILPIDLHTFSSFRTYRFSDYEYWIRYVNFFEIAVATQEYYSYTRDYLEGMFPILQGWDKLPILLGWEDNESSRLPNSKGFLSRNMFFEEQYSDLDEASKQRAAYHLEGYNYFDPALVNYFKMILEICNDKDIQVILIKYPVTMQYFNAATQYIPIETYNEQIDEIATEYNAVVFDYQKVFWGQNELFSDSDHINTKGASIFSEYIQKKLYHMGYLDK